MRTGGPELSPGMGNSRMKLAPPESGVRQSYWSKVIRISLEALLLPPGPFVTLKFFQSFLLSISHSYHTKNGWHLFTHVAQESFLGLLCIIAQQPRDGSQVRRPRWGSRVCFLSHHGLYLLGSQGWKRRTLGTHPSRVPQETRDIPLQEGVQDEIVPYSKGIMGFG